MKIFAVLRRLFVRHQQARRPLHARAVDEQQQLDQARAWQRPGGPVDPGLSA